MNAPNMTLKDVYQNLLKIEDDLDLFSYHIDGVYPWERIRFNVFANILFEVGLYEKRKTSKNLSSLNIYNKIKIYNVLLFDSIFHNPFFIKNIDFIFWGHQRRKIMDDGYYWDIYTDPIIPILDNYKSATIESYENWAHYKPAKTRNLYYSGMFQILSKINKYMSNYNKKNVFDFSSYVEGRIKQDFSVAVDIYSLTSNVISSQKGTYPIFSKFFKKTTPKICFTMASYSFEDFILAAKELSIPVVELQHGTISRYHLGYSYEGNRVKQSFPNYLFSFGEYWKNSVDYPIPKKNVLSIGYPYFEKLYEEKKSNIKINQIVFISQWTIGVSLSKFAVQTAKRLHGKINIVYKLHPWEEINECLIQASGDNLLQVVSGQTPSLYDLLSTSKWLVGVYSTAIYEGIALGCIPFIVNLPGVDNMELLFQKGFAKLVNDPEEIDLSYIPNEVTKDYLFADNWHENLKNGIEMVLNKSKGKRA